MKHIHIPAAETSFSEDERSQMTKKINKEARQITPGQLAEKYGQLWNTQQLQAEYEVHAFGAPFVEVTRKSDGQRGLLMFSHMPRFYHSFSAK